MIELKDLQSKSRLGLRPRELARALGVSEQTIRTWIATNELEAVRCGRSLFITPEALRKKRLVPTGWPFGGGRFL